MTVAYRRAYLAAAQAGVAAVVLLVPFQALLTTWLGSQFGHLDLFRIWKELLVFVLCLGGLGLAWVRPDIREWLFKTWPHRLMFAFSSYLAVMAVIGVLAGRVSPVAAVYGLLGDGRLFVAFLLAALTVRLGARYGRWPLEIMAPAAAVIGFGILQATVLPADVLTHFGYGPATIPAVHLVDNQTDYVRILSTLRGPNPLGAYIVAVVPLAAAYGWRRHGRSAWFRPAAFAAGLAVGFVLYNTYSSSAWLGFIVAISLFLLCSVRLKNFRRWAVFGGVCLAIVAAAGLYVARGSARFQNIFFHTSTASRSAESSNEKRTSALQSGLREAVHEPFGRGVGSAGPASARNTKAPARIAENFFVQIAQEAGLIGLGLFMAAYLMVGWQLWQRRANPYAAALGSSLVGLTLVNLISHAWMDDTLAYVWWISAALCLTEPAKRATLGKKRTLPKQSHAKTTTQTSPQKSGRPRRSRQAAARRPKARR